MYDYNTVQQLAKAEIEDIVKIDGIGPKKAETLIERARDFVEEIAARRRELELEQQEAEESEEDIMKDEADDEEIETEDVDDSDDETVEEESSEKEEKSE